MGLPPGRFAAAVDCADDAGDLPRHTTVLDWRGLPDQLAAAVHAGAPIGATRPALCRRPRGAARVRTFSIFIPRYTAIRWLALVTIQPSTWAMRAMCGLYLYVSSLPIVLWLAVPARDDTAGIHRTGFFALWVDYSSNHP